MKRKNGFTLIELLAVIVILAIIALIATPLVLKYIEKSRKESKVDSAYSFVRNLETEIANYSIKHNGKKFSVTSASRDYYVEDDFKDNEVDTKVKGDKPDSIKVCLSSLGQVEKAMFEYDKYYVSYDGKKGSISDKDTYDNFSCSGNGSDIVYRNVFPEQTLDFQTGIFDGWGCGNIDLSSDQVGIIANNGVYRLTIGTNEPVEAKLSFSDSGAISGNIGLMSGAEDKSDGSDNYFFNYYDGTLGVCYRNLTGTQTVRLEYINNIPILVEDTYTFTVPTKNDGSLHDYAYYEIDGENIINEGDIFTIKFDGVEYKNLVAKKLDTSYYVGNLASISSSYIGTEYDTGEKFVFGEDEAISVMTDALTNASVDGKTTTHTVSIYKHFAD